MSLYESEPTPQELKTGVIHILNQLPFAFPDPHPELTLEEIGTIYRRRYNSQYTRELVKKMGRLIAHSRPYTTRGFRRYLALEFELKCEFGVDKENPSANNLYLLLGLDFPNNYSIFDSEIIPMLEQRGYKELLMLHLDYQQGAIEAIDGFLEMADTRPELHDYYIYLSEKSKEHAEDPYSQKWLNNWRKEYFARWGDEP